MNLHEQSQDFQELVTITSQQLGIEEIYIEKDYFVVLALKSLSESDHRANGIFKGGTSLSKAYGVINRFSEDIDMAILNDNGLDIGNRRRMERVERALTSNECFTEDPDHLRVKKGSWLRQTVHNYPLLSEVENFGQVSKHVFVDVSRISPGLPFEEQKVNTYIHDYLKTDGQNEVIEEFHLQPVLLNVLSIERTFAEKLGTVVKFSSQPDGKATQPLDRLKSGIRHIYDLHMLIKDQRIQLFTQGISQTDGMNFNQFMERVLCDDLQGMREEEGYSQYMNSEFSQCFLLKDPVAAWKQLQATYEGDFKRLLFRNYEPPTSVEIINSLNTLRELCHQFDEWKKENGISFGD